MRLLLGWVFKLGFLGGAWLLMTGNLQVKFLESMLGYEVPPQARQWVDRNARINELMSTTQANFEQISDILK